MEASARQSPLGGVDAPALARELGARLGDGDGGPVVWVRDGSETIVHLDGLRADIAPGTVSVTVDFESDQLSRQPLEVTLVLATPDEPPGFFAVTPFRAGGDPALASRWGATFAESIWTAMLELADSTYGAPAAGIAADDGVIVVHAAGGGSAGGVDDGGADEPPRQPDAGT
jgi:hypothetical protein